MLIKRCGALSAFEPCRVSSMASIKLKRRRWAVNPHSCCMNIFTPGAHIHSDQLQPLKHTFTSSCALKLFLSLFEERIKITLKWMSPPLCHYCFLDFFFKSLFPSLPTLSNCLLEPIMTIVKQSSQVRGKVCQTLKRETIQLSLVGVSPRLLNTLGN